jgi:hypothetical protein
MQSAPVAYGYHVRGSAPRIRGAADNAVLITHSELISDVRLMDVDTFTFPQTLAKYYVNPGMGRTFPWLSNIAANFGFYRFRGVRFEFISSSPTSVGGEVEIVFDPDASNAAPISKSSLMNFKTSARGPPYQKLSLSVPQSVSSAQGRNGRRPVRSAESGFASDVLPIYDAGSLYFRAVGPEPLTTCGELWVHYEVELYNPQSVDNLSIVTTVKADNVSQSHLLGDTVTKYGSMSYSYFDDINSTFVVLGPGRYVMNLLWKGASLSAGVPFLSIAAGAYTVLSPSTEILVSNALYIQTELLVSQFSNDTAFPSGVKFALSTGTFGPSPVDVNFTFVRYSV